MSLYKVNFGDYCLAHSDTCTYFDYFEWNGKKYSIGAYIKLSEKGMSELFYGHGYNYIKNGFRLVDHFITENGCEKWEYIIGHLYNSNLPVLHKTSTRPDELISEVLCQPIDENIYTPGELKVEFKESKFNPSPKDWEVKGVMFGWIVMLLIWIVAFVFKDWWITLLVQISAGWCFGSWREKKINEAIKSQDFKK